MSPQINTNLTMLTQNYSQDCSELDSEHKIKTIGYIKMEITHKFIAKSTNIKHNEKACLIQRRL